jgi:predicted RNA-binding protein
MEAERTNGNNKSDGTKRLKTFELPDRYSATRIIAEHYADAQTFSRRRRFLKGPPMKLAIFALSALGAGIVLPNLIACSTESPGATQTLGVYSTNVDASPDKVTIAAQKAADDLKLTDILGNGTKVDGKVTAKDAQGDVVTIDIAQAGESVSKVTIHVGDTGNEALSKQLIDRINSHLSWL